VLRWFRFSDDFRNRMVFPLVALFFGTGGPTHAFWTCGWGACLLVVPAAVAVLAELPQHRCPWQLLPPGCPWLL
jgi:hypothetical protein